MVANVLLRDGSRFVFKNVVSIVRTTKLTIVHDFHVFCKPVSEIRSYSVK